ncbi:unnamed protein product [Prunus armeniaca]
MASTNLPPIMLDHLYSMDDDLKAEGPLLLLEDARKNPVVGDEPSPETAPVINPASVSRCYIEKGLFPAVPLFFQYPCSIKVGQNGSIVNCGIHPHATSCAESKSLMPSSFPNCGTSTSKRRCFVTWSGGGALLLTPLCAHRGNLPLPLKMWRISLAFLSVATSCEEALPPLPALHSSLVTGYNILGMQTDRDCLHECVFPLALAIARGDTIPLAPMFLGHLYHVFLWERLKGLDVYSLPHSHAIKLADWGNGSFMPNNLPLTMSRILSFVLTAPQQRPSLSCPSILTSVIRLRFQQHALLNVAPIPLPTLGDHCAEVSVTYSPHRVRRQFGLDQGVSSSPNHDDPFALHRIFWSNDHIPASCRPLVLASKARVGGFSRGYQAYWNHCLSSFREFQSFPGDRLPPTTARLAGLVSEEKAIPLSQKRNLPFISKSVDIVGEFPKTKPKPGVQSPGGSRKSATPASGKRKREEERNVSEKQTAPSGPPRTKEATPPEQPQPSKPAVSGSRGRAIKVLETTPSRRKMGTTPKRKRSDTPPVSPQVTPKRRSVRILHARFSGTCTSNVEAAGTPTVVIVDDDSDDSDTTESEANVPEQENVDDASEDSDRDFNEGCSEDAFAYSSYYPGGQGGSDVIDIAEDPNPAAAIADPARTPFEAEHVTSNLEIVPVVPSPFNTFDTLVEAALAGSFPTMTPTDSRDETPMLQVTNPLSPIFRHFLQMDLDPAISPAFPAAFRSNIFVVHTTLPVPSHVQPLLRATGPSPLALLPAVQCDNASAAENTQAIITVAGNAAAEHPRGLSWVEWEESFTAFMAFFDSGAQVLRSADELLPLYHRFNGYALFRGILVYPETVAALKKFLDKYGDFMDMTGITSSFSRCAAFRTLGLVLHGMDAVQLLDITDHRLLCWRDAVCEAMTLGFRAESLLNLVKGLAHAAFGARAVHNMKSNPGPNEIRAAAEALVFKQHELENQRRELRGLLSAQGVSSDSADCVIEAVTRSSHGASSVPF